MEKDKKGGDSMAAALETGFRDMFHFYKGNQTLGFQHVIRSITLCVCRYERSEVIPVLLV